MASEKGEKPRVIVTTDLEVDDMNSLVHLALYLSELDVTAFVYTASQYHFLGDGVHALGQVNPHWRTKGRRAYEWERVPREPLPRGMGRVAVVRPLRRRMAASVRERRRLSLAGGARRPHVRGQRRL